MTNNKTYKTKENNTFTRRGDHRISVVLERRAFSRRILQNLRRKQQNGETELPHPPSIYREKGGSFKKPP
jgi:hypothetical protein